MHIRKQKGVAAVELAIILIPMLILCFGITELGRALYQYNGLVKATRTGVRYLSQQSFGGTDAEAIRLKGKSLTLCGYDDCASKPPLATGLTLDMISVCDPVSCAGTHDNVPTGEGPTDLVSVYINAGSNKFSFTSLVPWVIPDISFSRISTTMAASTN